MHELNEKYDIVLNVNEEYETFGEFYSENQYVIFKKFIEFFKMMENTNKELYSLCINWKLNDSEINTEYHYDHSSIDILNTVLLPYFENMEEYEVCSEILKTYKTLKNKYNGHN